MHMLYLAVARMQIDIMRMCMYMRAHDCVDARARVLGFVRVRVRMHVRVRGRARVQECWHLGTRGLPLHACPQVPTTMPYNYMGAGQLSYACYMVASRSVQPAIPCILVRVFLSDLVGRLRRAPAVAVPASVPAGPAEWPPRAAGKAPG